MVRRVLQVGLVAIIAVAMAMLPSGAATVNLPTEFTSGGVLWGDLSNDHTGFSNDFGSLCDLDVYVQGDAKLLSTGQEDAFDGTGGVVINGQAYLVPPGTDSAPVDLTGSKLATATAPVGGLNVSTEYYGVPSAPTLRYLVALENPSGATVSTTVNVENNLGSDDDTYIQGSSSGQSTSYPANERWFATSEGNTDPAGDPPVLSVVTGPGTVRSPGSVAPCDGLSRSQEVNDAKAAAEQTPAEAPTEAEPGATESSPEASAAPDGGVSAAGTFLGQEEYVYSYLVTVPAGETRYLLVYWGVYGTIAESVAAGPAFDTTPSAGDPLIAGLDQQTLCRVVNWDFGSCLSFTG